MYLDLPPDLPSGPATIALEGPDGFVTPTPVVIEILPGTGKPMLIGPGENPVESANLFASLERAEHATVAFSGPAVPHAIHVELTRTPGTRPAPG